MSEWVGWRTDKTADRREDRSSGLLHTLTRAILCVWATSFFDRSQ
jgi:hypothetical protein